MASKNLLTEYAKVIQSELMYYYPVITYPLNPTINLSSIYCFLGKVDPWGDDNNPPAPLEDQQSTKAVFKNMFALKQIQSGDISPVIARIDWKKGTSYDYYKDFINMLDTNPDGSPKYIF